MNKDILPKQQRRGASASGYGLVVGLISVVALGAITNVGGSVVGLFTDVADNLEGTQSGGASGSPTVAPSPSASVSPSPNQQASCLTLLNAGNSGNGTYQIDPDGPGGAAAFTVYCDMGGGGYTLSSAGTPFTFAYTGSAQSFPHPTIPGTWEVTLKGAQGGKARTSPVGGSGATLIAEIDIVQSDTVSIYVGGAGSDDGPGGFNGGGTGAAASDSSCTGDTGKHNGGGGGGASDIRLNGTALSDRVLVAGGGGGQGNGASSTASKRGHGGGGSCGSDYCGGQGGGGNNGTDVDGKDGGLEGGLAATSALRHGAGGGGRNSGGKGSPGDPRYFPGTGGQDGSFGVGGDGDDNYTQDSTPSGGSGGGGGWYGGGGTGNAHCGHNVGGGGSSYWGTATLVNHVGGNNTGNGEVTIRIK